MRTHIIEVTNGPNNWGKFLLGQFDDAEWNRKTAIFADGLATHTPLLRQIGWSRDGAYCLVLDLQTGEGAVFRLGGLASADLNKHKIWVCPMFEPFLEWLYAYRKDRDGLWWDTLPTHVDLPDAPFALHGYRREGRS